MVYTITRYTRIKANQIGVVVKPSTNVNKKIDVYRNGIKIASVGDTSYYDYPTYIKLYGREYADERRRLYRIRHKSDRTKRFSPGWLANWLLW